MSAHADPATYVAERPASDYSLPAGAGLMLAVVVGSAIWGGIFMLIF